ncbi:uncharacterized protein LOC114356076 [Ostrinia furnacalis]|uniref:uncharacterized protein LOC114356076 n=1 Tax=Ostrinia furnacalis TaxID=93504 RepID=UPI00103E02E7|nr:uncharacterized protein LOC114356076 [Ostrinia furnacalis]
MPFVFVTGFPRETKLVPNFRKYFRSARLPRYWITKVIDNPTEQAALIDFQSFGDALKAEQYINSVPFVKSTTCYNLTARITNSEDDTFSSSNQYDGQYEYRRSRSREHSLESYGYSRSSDRDRSRSPFEDPSKLDLELELIRKKRLLIEEERRLLLEKQKLQMMKEYGANACEELDVKPKIEFGAGKSTLFNSHIEMERDQRNRDMLLRPHWTGKPEPRSRAPRFSAEQRPLDHIPQFILPVKIILKSMKTAIKNEAPDLHERNILTKMIGGNLRRRFAIVLENRPYTPSDKIVQLYRQQYPMSTDRELIKKTYQDVKACHWPKRQKSQKTLDKIARRKFEKMQAKQIVDGVDSDTPGTSTDAAAVDVKPDPDLVVKEEKPIEDPVLRLDGWGGVNDDFDKNGTEWINDGEGSLE